MRIIKKLSELICEELGDSEKYAKLALELKDSMPDIAEMFYALSIDEMKHMGMLHNSVTRVISEHEEDPDPRTEGMKAAYEIIHEREIEWEKSVKILQSMYRG